jgi:hypothetical protein
MINSKFARAALLSVTPFFAAQPALAQDFKVVYQENVNPLSDAKNWSLHANYISIYTRRAMDAIVTYNSLTLQASSPEHRFDIIMRVMTNPRNETFFRNLRSESLNRAVSWYRDSLGESAPYSMVFCEQGISSERRANIANSLNESFGYTLLDASRYDVFFDYIEQQGAAGIYLAIDHLSRPARQNGMDPRLAACNAQPEMAGTFAPSSPTAN